MKQRLLYNIPKLHISLQLSNLNPIFGHLWSILGDAIRKRQISYREDLKTALREEWKSFINHQAKSDAIGAIDAPKITDYGCERQRLSYKILSTL